MALLFLIKIYLNLIFMLFNNKILIVSCFFIQSCVCNKKNKTANEEFRVQILNNYCKTEKGILISCFRCSCVTSFIQSYIDKGGKINLYADTSCFNSKSKNVLFLSQKVLDSVYETNYNAIVYKNLNKGKKFKYLLLKTEDSENFSKIINEFLKNP